MVTRDSIRRTTGISLLEVMVAMALIALVAGLALTGSSGSNEKLHSSSLAKIVRDSLLQSRAKARAEGQAVGIAFPGLNTYGAQGFYTLIGTKRMRILKPRSYSSEFGTSYVTWAPANGEALTDNLTSGPYDLAAMSGLNADDPVVLFLPSGEALVRGVAYDGTHYHLRVGSQPSGSAGGLSGLSNAWDIKFDVNGSMSLAKDASFPAGSGSGPALADLPPASANPTSSPSVVSLSAYPELVENSTGLILATEDEPINLVAEATSPNELPLQIRWTADGGQFSDTGDWLPMTYSRDDDRWKSSILWSLPPAPTSTYNVSVEVRDQFGNASASTTASELVFDTDPVFPWEMFFVSRTASSLVSSIERMNGDGSGRVKLLEDLVRPPRILPSPNGEFIAWKTGDYTIDDEIYISSREGTRLHTVRFPRAVGPPFQWRSDSTTFVVTDVGMNPTTVWEISPTTGVATVLCTIPSEAQTGSASADLRYFAYRTASNRYDAVVYDRINDTETTIFSGDPAGYGPVGMTLSAQGNYCGFYDQTGPGHRSILARSDGSGHLDLGWGAVTYVTPDESTILYHSRTAARGGTVTCVVADIDGTTRFTEPSLTDYSAYITPDSRYSVQLVRSFADYRLQSLDLQTGEINTLSPDDGLNKFWLGFGGQ